MRHPALKVGRALSSLEHEDANHPLNVRAASIQRIVVGEARRVIGPDPLQRNNANRGYVYLLRVYYYAGQEPPEMDMGAAPFDVFVVYSDQIDAYVTGDGGGANQKRCVLAASPY